MSIPARTQCRCFCHQPSHPGAHCRRCYRKHDECAICRAGTELTAHHLMPQEFATPGAHIHERYGRITYEERIIKLCRECHELVHDTFTNAQLLYRYNTAEKLLDSAVFRAHLRNQDIPVPESVMPHDALTDRRDTAGFADSSAHPR